MISAEKARENVMMYEKYKEKIYEHLNKIDSGIIDHSFMGLTSCLYMCEFEFTVEREFIMAFIETMLLKNGFEVEVSKDVETTKKYTFIIDWKKED